MFPGQVVGRHDDCVGIDGVLVAGRRSEVAGVHDAPSQPNGGLRGREPLLDGVVARRLADVVAHPEEPDSPGGEEGVVEHLWK